MKTIFFAIPVAALLFSSCVKEHDFKDLPTGFVHHHLIAVGRINKTVKLRGFLGATPAKSSVAITIDQHKKTLISDDDGRFYAEMTGITSDIDSAVLRIEHGNQVDEQTYSIKMLTKNVRDIVAAPFDTDKEIDAIEYFPQTAWILSSQSSLIRSFAIDSLWQLAKKSMQSLLMDPGTSLGTRTIKKMGTSLLAPFFKTHEIGVIDTTNDTLATKSRLKDADGNLSLFTVSPPCSLNIPINADEQGESLLITKTAARNPEAILPLDEEYFLASFVNYFQFADSSAGIKSVVAPGILSLMRYQNQSLSSPFSLVLPCKNPSQILKEDEHNFIVLCSGAFRFSDEGLSSDGAGIVKILLDKNLHTLSMLHHLELVSFTPSPMALVNNKLIIPKAWSNEVLVISPSAPTIHHSDIKKAQFYRTHNFTFAMHWHDDIVFLGDNQGSLVAFSLSDGFFPFPFIEPLIFYKDADVKLALGPQKIYFRHQVENYDLSTTHKKGYDAWIQTSTHRLFPVDFMQVFGP